MSDQDDIKDLPLDNEHSESENQDAVAQAKPEQPDSAASSDAHDGTETDDGLLSVARGVIDAKLGKSGEAASSADNSEAGETGSKAQKEADDENYSDVPFHKHPRFQQVLGRMKSAEQDAVHYRNVQSFIDQNGLTGESAAEALTIAGMMRTNPAQAWKTLQPILQNLLVAAGEALPPDLQQRVDSGELPPAAALEISRSRAGVQSIEQQRAMERERQQETARTDHARTLRGTAEAWEADRQDKDPNYHLKAEGIAMRVVYLQRLEGVPDTVGGVRDQLKRAYEMVNKDFRPPAPPAQRRPPTRPVVGGQPAASAQKPVYNSTLDIIRAKTGQAAAS